MERIQWAKLIEASILPGASRPREGSSACGGLQCLSGDWLVSSRDPVVFRSAFALACAADSGRVVVCDPSWGNAERTQLIALLARSRAHAEKGWLCVPTGGSSGVLKLARHDGYTIAAAIIAFRNFFALEKVSAVGVLPLHHVSGLMAWLRSVATGGCFTDLAWADLEAGKRPDLGPDRVISLVPTQLQRLLRDAGAADWLRGFKIVFLGGGPSWSSLLDNARTAGLRICLSYGMTETAAMVSALPPEEFVAGGLGAGRAMPRVSLTIDANGLVCVDAPSLFFGYTGGPDRIGPFLTEDLGSLTAEGTLFIEGRQDSMIITGGKKVAPAEVEAAIRSTGLLEDVMVTALPDADWGQAVSACVPASVSKEVIAKVSEALEGELAPYKQPKRWIQLVEWPRDAKGKLKRSMLRAQLRPLTGETGSCSCKRD